MRATHNISRRRWLQTAGQAALAAGWAVSAPVFSQQSAGRVVVGGGGFGGATMSFVVWVSKSFTTSPKALMGPPRRSNLPADRRWLTTN